MATAKMKWTGGLKFEGTSAFGHKIATDGAKSAGGQEDGYKPTELLLYGMAGCAGIDIVRILEKQRQKLTSLEIEVTAHQNDDYPRPFHTVEVKFIARGENLDENKLAKAIELSESKYCVVSQTIANQTKVVVSHEILPD
jgi:putative redox protein